MAVEKMHFINIVGPKNDLDDFVSEYLVHRDVELVNTMSVLDDVKGITPYIVENPYTHLLKGAKEAMNKLNIDINEEDLKAYANYDVSDLFTHDYYIDELNKKLKEWDDQKKAIEKDLKKKETIRKQLLLLQDLDVEVDRFFHFEFIKFRFGSLPKYNYDKLEHYTENVDVVVFEVFREEDQVYIMYFSPDEFHEKVDSLFSSLYFQRVFISGEVEGCPKDALAKVDHQIEELHRKLGDLKHLVDNYAKDHIEKIKYLYYGASKFYQVFHVRRYAAHSKEIFCLHGWIPESQIDGFTAELDKSTSVSYVLETPEEVPKLKPPTKLKNNPIFRPFQELVKMYGIPSYNEFDPTPLVAITYMILFGMMFGDIGQGLVLSTIGYLVYKKAKTPLGKIVMMIGFSSAFFGILYGSIFGIEEIGGQRIFHLISPMENQFVILGMGIGFGIILIIVAMCINIFNCLKNKNFGKALFDKNGVIGLFFYLALLGMVAGIATNLDFYEKPWFIIPCLVIPVIILFLSHPIMNFVNHAKEVFPQEKGSFFVEAFFEVFEILLSILSNTLSFVRVGAFALNHVGLFMAVHELMKMTSEVGGVVILILGNVIIIGLEGLIVGIQGLRLEYYELFSRFFQGDGREIHPFKIKYDTEV